jgi:Xaa-Pro aminopeptidase
MRLNRLKSILRRELKFPYFIPSLVNIKYLTGFQGSFAYLVVDEDRVFFISDSRYEEYARSILPSSVVFVLQENDFSETLKNVVKGIGKGELYLEEHSLFLSNYLLMKRDLRGIKLVPGGDVVDRLRMIKDEDEISSIRKAAEITDACFKHLLGIIRPGIIEWDIAVEIEYFYRKNGCSGASFDSIVASGKGSSMPHYATSMVKKIERGDMLLIDMGCVYEGYNSDLTRTVFMTSIEPAFERIYSIVREAQKAALERVRPGVLTGSLDGTARGIITDAGYGKTFGHSLGHGLGLEVHELPAVKSKGDIRLRKNMVITIEPGIYIPESGGVRIEDMVLVTSNGGEVLTTSPKDITVV